MQFILDILLKSRAAGKLYEKMFGKIRLQYGMTQLEIDILAFLKNNPGLDTASDIVNYRMLPKANVSQAVEFLIQKGFVGRRTDEQDRRKIHGHDRERKTAVSEPDASDCGKYQTRVGE